MMGHGTAPANEMTNAGPLRARLIMVGISLAILILSGCSPRGYFEAFSPQTAPLATQTIFVATQRDGPSLLALSGDRVRTLRYGRIDVSIPAEHEVGQIEWARDGEGFGVAGAWSYPEASGFRRAIQTQPGASDDVIVVFVPGYNMTLAEATYRQAQIAHDYQMTGPQVLFAWPSAAEPLGYIYDRDSAIFARDALEGLLADLGRQQDRRILLVGHSMGGQLVTETLRQMSIGGNTALNGRLEGVVLLSPDIDVDVFQTQLDRIDPLPDPFVIVVSQRDRALRLSARLSGQTQRLGSIEDIRRLAAYRVTIVDLGEIRGNGDNDHLIPATSPVAISLLRGLRENGLPAPPPDDGAIQAVQVVLRLPE
ncbi:alpha/beta hydrolase [Yoonia algicola]|uniref:Alpha/beta fold hydrolase n=1 Tax=Yoonia algicola TaxID=3137368 RepID=A0AAN0NJQ7_9RHOB